MNLDNTSTWHSVERDIPYVCITLPVGLCSRGRVSSGSVSALAFSFDTMRHPVIRFRTNVMAWSLPSPSGMWGSWNCTKKIANTVLLQSFNVSAKETSVNYGTETLAVIFLGNLSFNSLKLFNKLFEEKVNAIFFFFENRVFKNYEENMALTKITLIIFLYMLVQYSKHH